MSRTTTPPTIHIGHVHLHVTDLQRATTFYRDVLGFDVTINGPAMGLPSVFAPADDHHHIALNTFGLKPAGPAPPGLSGVYHFALLYPKPEALIDAVERLRAHHYPIGYGSDHGGSVSIHLEDPDGNGIELYWDRPGGPRVDASGNHMVRGERFDPADLRSVLERPVCRPAA